ncbi:hypothetical protein [Mycobacterium ostraviense]|uniref:Lipoprotein lppJ n=1 Tax=Mycobacterium ostraviense TaxID=2738409 RepID=A0A163UF37_9MYCO|nr:hypothetical protein [Mycobacterium ostraviense]KZS56220.1 hypothetical protein A4G28_01940 [Mycobacterium ostraviense]UGT93398.1 hypothetical protein LTS72_09035 [Mycobacterium ostraviense]
MYPFAHDADRPEHPLSDEQAMAQVIEPAKQIAKVAGLQDVSGEFGWESCNDQGDPPYRGRVNVKFNVPAGMDHNAYFEQVAATMVAHGWLTGPPPGLRPFGTAIHKDGVMAIIGVSPFLGADGDVELSGECRNMGDHRHARWLNISDQLRGG